MADDTSDKRSRMKDPLTVSLAALAAVGWALAFTAWINGNSEQERLTAEIDTLRTSEADVRVQLADQVEAAGTFEEVSAELESARTELERVTGERETADADLARLRDEYETTSAQLDDARAEVERLKAEVEPLNATLAGFDEKSAEAESRLEEARGELSEIGGRLEQARTQEAELQSAVSDLSDEAARVSEEAAQAATKAQTARETEADMRAKVEAAQAEADRLEAERETLSAAIADLTERRDTLSETVAALSDQRGDLQSMVVDLTAMLASRSDRLEEVESTLLAAATEGEQPAGNGADDGADSETGSGGALGLPAAAIPPNETAVTAQSSDAGAQQQDASDGAQAQDEAQAQDGSQAQDEAQAQDGSQAQDEGQAEDGSRSAETDVADGSGAADDEAMPLATLEPGVYKDDVFMVTFSDDGEFNIIDTIKNSQAHGDYELSDGVLSLRSDQRDEGMGSYPMTCQVSRVAEGILFASGDGKCALLAGAILTATE